MTFKQTYTLYYSLNNAVGGDECMNVIGSDTEKKLATDCKSWKPLGLGNIPVTLFLKSKLHYSLLPKLMNTFHANS